MESSNEKMTGKRKVLGKNKLFYMEFGDGTCIGWCTERSKEFG